MPHFCDCGKPAYRKASSGWTCQSCEQYVRDTQRMLDELILRRKAEREALEMSEDDPRKEYQRLYAITHRDKARARYRKWAAKQPPKVQERRDFCRFVSATL